MLHRHASTYRLTPPGLVLVECDHGWTTSSKKVSVVVTGDLTLTGGVTGLPDTSHLSHTGDEPTSCDGCMRNMLRLWKPVHRIRKLHNGSCVSVSVSVSWEGGGGSNKISKELQRSPHNMKSPHKNTYTQVVF